MDLRSIGLFLLVAAALCGACEEGKKTPVVDSCSHYAVCQKGVQLRKYCGLFKRFDPAKGECSTWWKVKCPKVECNEDDRKPAVGVCKSYFECRKGAWVEDSCGFLKDYDPVKKECVGDYDCKGTPQCEEGERRVVEGECRAYQECSKGKWAKKSCFVGWNYDGKAKECKFQYKCPECAEGETRSVDGECGNYMKCDKGRLAKASCPLLKRFDPVTEECVWWFEASCKDEECRAGDRRPGSGGRGSFHECGKDGQWKAFDCKPPNDLFDPKSKKCVPSALNLEESCRGTWKRPVKGDCSKYQECVAGAVVNKSCTVMMRFDRQALECRFGWFVRCDDSGAKKPAGPGGLLSSAPVERKCKDNERKPVRGSCTDYAECRDGEWTRETCLLGKSFDLETATCRPKAEATCAPPSWEPSFLFKECQEGRVKPVDFRCDGFKLCSEGLWQIASCDSGQRFDSKSLKCVPFAEATCYNPECKEGARVRDPTDCRAYRECVEGLWKAEKCYPLRRYDDSKAACGWMWKVGCSERRSGYEEETVRLAKGGSTGAPSTTATAPPAPTTTSAPAPTTAPPAPTTMAPGGNCPNGTNLPVDGSCKEYDVCDPSTGVLTRARCSGCKNFDPEARKCSWVWRHPCWDDGPHTPTPECQDGQRLAVDCKNYKECKGGKWEGESCWWPKKFDSVSLECVWKGAKC